MLALSNQWLDEWKYGNGWSDAAKNFRLIFFEYIKRLDGLHLHT